MEDSRLIEISKDERFGRLADLVLEWNEKINVTAIRDREEFMDKNVMDSLALIGRPEIETAEKILDLGTGGGFPGLPLAIAYPDKEFYLVDSIGKKIKVVSDVAEKLGLSNVHAFQARAEEIGSSVDYREKFDLVVSRAVANMSSLSEYCIPLVKPGGYFVAYKTVAAEEEIRNASNAVKLLGGAEIQIVPDGRESNEHVFAVIKKIAPTPKKYPRSGGAPLKKPL